MAKTKMDKVVDFENDPRVRGEMFGNKKKPYNTGMKQREQRRGFLPIKDGSGIYVQEFRAKSPLRDGIEKSTKKGHRLGEY